MIDLAQITDIILYQYFRRRQKKIQHVVDHPKEYQNRLLSKILLQNQSTVFGKKYRFDSIKEVENYRLALPLQNYESLFPYIEKCMDDAADILLPGKVKWFAKSSGTSNARSKYIPVTQSYLNDGHLKCAWDAASHIYNENPDAKLFAHKNLIMGGHLENLDHGKIAGDISAIILHHFPKIGRRYYTPKFETALLPDWDLKINKIAEETIKEKVTLLAGVPTWTIVLLREILKQSGKNNINEVWPDLTTYLHGGVGFEPFRSEFRKLIPSNQVGFREVYNASEGYFAMQNNVAEEGMLLLCDHSIYYEFIPIEEVHNSVPTCLSLEDVSTNESYAIVITTTAGLYRYVVGDVITFTSLRPYKIKVTGRINEMINAFGEEVSAYNTDLAIARCSRQYNVTIRDYTVAPKYMTDGDKAWHDWYIEFERAPKDIEQFQKSLDEELQNINSDYAAKRSSDLAMKNLKITTLPKGSFDAWMRSHNRYGGQTKVPRLSNERSIVDELQLATLKPQ